MSSATIDHVSNPAFLLSLPEIAAWQVKRPAVGLRSGESERPPIACDLPALQRGAVWSAAQTEALWDSLVRGFPLGTFQIMPYSKELDLGRANMPLAAPADPDAPRPEYYLLDGQQRATAVALGFLDLWGEDLEHNDGPALWVDLAPPSKRGDDRAYVFRVLTRSHPWGYNSNTPTARLTHGQIRAALICYRTVGGQADARGSNIPLRYTWPWDASCPLPVPLLLGAAEGDGHWRVLLEARLKKLPHWRDAAVVAGGGRLIDGWQDALKAADSGHRGTLANRLERLITVLQEELSRRRVPALVLPDSRDLTDPPPNVDPTEPAAEPARDEVETLFTRVNAEGTLLGGEELVYSSLKAAWPDAPDVLDRLQGQRRIFSAARMVIVLYRLHGAFLNGQMIEQPPRVTAVTEFRRSIRQATLRHKFKEFVNNGKPIVDDLLTLVRLDKAERDPSPWRLPPTLAAQVFSGPNGLDLVFIFAAWLMRLHQAGRRLSDLTDTQRRMSLGFLVSLHWFSQSSSRCVALLWDSLRQLPTSTDFGDFFSQTRFTKLVTVENGKVILLPPAPPSVIKALIAKRVTSDDAQKQAEYWSPGTAWAHYNSALAPPHFRSIRKEVRAWLSKLTLSLVSNSQEDEMAPNELRREAWDRFLDTVWSQRGFVDYAQRVWLMRWFGDFDPTLPGQMEDTNRPWDYDHIHPQGLLCNKIPTVIREWHQSIGNLRAWPLELNRGDQSSPPREKLTNVDDDTRRFGIRKIEELRDASFIRGLEQLAAWQKSTPEEDHFRYLARFDHPEFDEARRALVKAIGLRFCALYEHWYKSLYIGNLGLPEFQHGLPV